MNALATIPQPQAVEQALIQGDLSKLNVHERLSYYKAVCESVGLNPLTRPLDYITLQGKLILYAKRDATDQIRKMHGVSITKIETKEVSDVYVVTAYARDKEGREDSSTGAVSLTYPDKIKDRNGNWINHPKAGQKFTGDDLANALMKAETKAKRRATLSICGLGLLDETEVSTIPDAKIPTMAELEAGAANYEQQHAEVIAKVERSAEQGNAFHCKKHGDIAIVPCVMCNREADQQPAPLNKSEKREAQHVDAMTHLGRWQTAVDPQQGILRCYVVDVRDGRAGKNGSLTLEVRHTKRNGDEEVGTFTSFTSPGKPLYEMVKSAKDHNCEFKLSKTEKNGRTYLNIVELLKAEAPEAVKPFAATDEDIPF